MEIMIKLDPEINHTVIRAIKTMTRIPVSTRIMHVYLYTRAAFVAEENRLQEGRIVKIGVNGFRIKKPNDTEADILYKNVKALYLGNIKPGISKINGDLVAHRVLNKSGEAINVESIVPKCSPQELDYANNLVIEGDGESVRMWSQPPAESTADSFNMLELRIAPIFFNAMEDAGALPISMEDIGDPIDLISITLHRLEGKE
jgi:hypothetical protein